VTEGYPKDELYGLVFQMRRSSISIPCNIAEGYRRGHVKEYVQFLWIAQGSCGELETLVFLSKDLGFVGQPLLTYMGDRTKYLGS
jgi:four helix bundle protein